MGENAKYPSKKVKPPGPDSPDFYIMAAKKTGSKTAARNRKPARKPARYIPENMIEKKYQPFPGLSEEDKAIITRAVNRKLKERYKTPAKPKQARVPWRTSEILYAVVGYLTTREKPLILGGAYECSAVAEILGKIVEANGLPKTRRGYPKIKIPDGLENITNMPKRPEPNHGCGVGPMPAPNPVAAIIDVLMRQNPEAQNDILKEVLTALIQHKHTRIKSVEEDLKQLRDELDARIKNLEGLKAIATGGNF